MERGGEAVAFQFKIDNKVSTVLGSGQCAYFLMQKHRWCECRSCLIGKPPAERPLGMSPARKFPPPPSKTRSKGKRNGPGAFTAMNVAIENKSCEETYMFTSTNSDAEVSLLCDSGANVHMAPGMQDLRDTHRVDRIRTSGNKGQL